MVLVHIIKQAYSKNQWIQLLYRMSMHVVSLPLLLFLYALRPIYQIRLFRTFNEDRIGHLSMNTDLFLRRIQLHDPRKKNECWIGFASTRPANKQLLTMFIRAFQKQGIKIILVPSAMYELLIKGIINERSLFGKSKFYLPLPAESNEFYEFNNTTPNISFTDEEEKKGKELLKKMGLPDDAWFVCIHSRDAAFSSRHIAGDHSHHTPRYCSILHFLEAAEYITSQGGYVLRMGSEVDCPIKTDNPRIIDYATTHRNDFGDIYLAAKCKFFLGCASGLFVVSNIFHVPVAITNIVIPIHPPFREGDLFIPKKVLRQKEKRYLSLHEMLTFEKNEAYMRNGILRYNELGLVPVANSSTEIHDLAQEMNKRIDGTWKSSEQLQQRFRNLSKNNLCGGTPARMGSSFLKRNPYLLSDILLDK